MYLHAPLESGQRQDREFYALLAKCTPQGPWIAGGAIRRFYFEEYNPSDIDLWFASPVQLQEFREWLAAQGAVITQIKKRNETWDWGGTIIQLVTGAFFETLAQVLESFDFRMCKFGTDGVQITYDEWAPDDSRNKILMLTLNQNLPLYTLARIHKYAIQGFEVPTSLVHDTLRVLSESAYTELQKAGETGGGS